MKKKKQFRIDFNAIRNDPIETENNRNNTVYRDCRNAGAEFTSTADDVKFYSRDDVESCSTSATRRRRRNTAAVERDKTHAEPRNNV